MNSNPTASRNAGARITAVVAAGILCALAARCATAAAPVISKTFLAPQPVSTDIKLRFTVTNPAVNAVPLTGVSFTDVLPTNVYISNTVPAVAPSCFGTAVSAPLGQTTITLSGATLPVGGQCVFDVLVRTDQVALYTNQTGFVTSTNGGTGNRASAPLDVLYRPDLSKSFSQTPTSLGGTSTLSLRITNWNLVALSGVSIDDVFPAGMEVANPPSATNNCGGALTGASAGSTALHLTGGSVAGYTGTFPTGQPGRCTLSVQVKATQLVIPSNTGTMFSTNAGGASASATLSVTSTSLSSTANPSVYGQTVTFTATVNGAGANPAGTMSFTNDGAPLASCSNLPLASGQAQCSTSALATGSRAISAQYSGGGGVPASTGALTQQVNKANTTTSITAPQSVTVQQPLSVTANVAVSAPGSGTPGGTVTVTSTPGGEQCTIVRPATTCNLTPLTTGNKSLTAVYSGDGNFNVSTSPAVGYAVNPAAAPTVTTLLTSATPTVFGQTVTFTASVSGGGGSPGGTVTFTSDGAPIASCAGLPLVSAQASCSSTALAVGAHAILAQYSGTPTLASSTGAVSQTVNKANTTTSVTAPQSVTVQQPLSVTANVAVSAPGSGTPGGTVTVTSTPGGEQCTIVRPATTCNLTPLTTGNKSLTAVYSGDGNFNGSTSAAFAYAVYSAVAPTVTTLLTSSTPTVFGQNVTFTASVSGGGGSPGGTVTFTSDGAPMASCSGLPLVSAQVSCSSATLAVGAHAILAQYSGTPTLASSTGAVSQTVNKANTATVLSAPASGTVGQAMSVSVNVTAVAPGAGQPTGSITIAAVPGGENCTVSQAPGSCSIVPSSAGTRMLSATYGGNGNFNGSTSNVVAVAIENAPPIPTTTVVTAVSPVAAVYGQPVSVSVAVTAISGLNAPSGNATIHVGGNVSGCSAALTPVTTAVAAGSCTLQTPLPPSNQNYAVTAKYDGNSEFGPSESGGTGNRSLTVSKSSISISIDAHTPDPSAINGAVQVATHMVVVPPGTGTPTGTVTIASSDPATDHCDFELPQFGCALTLTTPGLKLLTASYSGDANFKSTLSPTVSHTVGAGGPVGTTTEVALVQPQGAANASAIATAFYGQPVTVTVRVAATGVLAPDGSVNVEIEGETSSCTAVLSAQPGAVSVGACALSGALPVRAAPYVVKARYAGNSTFAASDAGNGRLTLVKAGTNAAIVAHAPPITSNLEPIAVSVRIDPVAPGSGAPTGTVTVSDGVANCAITLPASSCNLLPLLPGTRSLVARYAGDGNFNESVSQSVAHMVTAVTQSGELPTSSGTGTAKIEVDGTGCSLATACFVDPTLLPREGLPNNVSFPQGIANFAIGGCGESTVKVTINYPQPLPIGTNYWKYGPTRANPTAHWYVLPSTISGNRIEITINDGGLGDDDLTLNGIIRDPGGPATRNGTVIEFYNAILDHYFITADPTEAASIDSGSSGPGWARTGASFSAGGGSAVCRFYGSLTPGPNSHFYTVDGDECQQLKALQAATPAAAKRWNFESFDFLSNRPRNGACPVDTVPVYRAYNNGFLRGIDSNHRITSDLSGIQQVVERGWINEGLVMCAPGQSGETGGDTGGVDPAVCPTPP